VTSWGKFIGSIVVILGIGLFALPTGVLASGFAEVLARRKEVQKKAGMICPHCGRHIGDAAGRAEVDCIEFNASQKDF
jgi:voltage-gated potassium channel